MTSSGDLGFSFDRRSSGEVRISRHGRVVTILRGDAAARFLRKIESADPQQVMARASDRSGPGAGGIEGTHHEGAPIHSEHVAVGEASEW
jgi:hypothetical protein